MTRHTHSFRRAPTVATFFLLCLFASGVSGQNLATDPGIENWTNPETPEHWTVFGVGAAGFCELCTATQDTEIFRHGSASLNVHVPANTENFFGFPGISSLPIQEILNDDFKEGDEFYGEAWVFDGDQGEVIGETRQVFVEVQYIFENQEPTKFRPSLQVATFSELISDGNGRFRIADISPTILPPGSYDVRVKARHTLSRRASRVRIPASDSAPFASPALAVKWESLPYGDVDNNHVVDDADVAALKTSFGRRSGESRFNSQADFNSDQIVDGQDFSLMAQNYLNRSP